MLDAVRAEYFSALIGQACRVEPESGQAFMLTVERVRMHPGARLPGDPAEKREPFSVLLAAAGETGWVEGVCAIELPDVGRLDKLQIARTVPQSADTSKAYYQIMFN